jgi:lysophospholipase L1-like esterase
VVNRGIAGQTSAQMLLRFRQDVVALRPRVVHIMAGLNDIAGRPAAVRMEDYQNNIRSMVDIARANGIAVVLGNVTPAQDRPKATIAAANRWLRAFAVQRGVGFVDYDLVLLDAHGNPRPGFFTDGVHLTERAYAAMRPLTEAAIAGQMASNGGH